MGQPKEELFDREVGGGLTPEGRQKVESLLRQCIETGQGMSRRVMQREIDGRIIYTAGHLAPLRGMPPRVDMGNLGLHER